MLGLFFLANKVGGFAVWHDSVPITPIRIVFCYCIMSADSILSEYVFSSRHWFDNYRILFYLFVVILIFFILSCICSDIFLPSPNGRRGKLQGCWSPLCNPRKDQRWSRKIRQDPQNGVAEKAKFPPDHEMKDKNGTSSSSSWNTLPTCSRQHTSKYTRTQGRRNTIVTVFVVDKKLNKIDKSSKYYIIKMLASLVVNIQ